MANDVILNKIQVIRRCCERIREEYDGNPEHLTNYTKQDSIILNLQRACEAAIDLAMFVVSERKLGLPQTSRDAFDLLLQERLIPDELGQNLKAMVGFRNIAVHNYQAVNLEIVKTIIEDHLSDFSDFAATVLKLQN
jgi:uncharacterized protein YutE (UPF0331/DUF86 family)